MSASPADKLVRMANQMADFFRSYPQKDAVAGIADHITSFWTPRMRGDLLAHAAAGAQGIDPLVAGALKTLGQGRQPAGDSPVERGTAGPETVGQLGSDAG